MALLACDFGTSNTVLSLWDEATGEGRPVELPGISRLVLSSPDHVPVIPSLIHYTRDGRQWIGQQVHAENRFESVETFKWMKSAVSLRNPSQRRVHGRRLTASEAAGDFLRSVLTLAQAGFNVQGEEVAFTVPVETYEHYTDWLGEVSASVGIHRYRFIDEPSAAALGYGAHIQPGNVYLMFDFGGGTLDVAVILIESEEEASAGRRCRVLGKAGLDLGGSTIDQWLFAEVLRRNELADTDEIVLTLGRALMNECERAKEKLSTNERADISVMDPDSGEVLGMEWSRDAFEDLAEAHGLFEEITRTIDRALNDSITRGYGKDDIHSVLMLGGSSLIPSVQKTVQRLFGRNRVLLNRPLDAVSRGAAAFAAGVDFYDHIQHDYAIRYVDPASGLYQFKTIIQRGISYPTEKPVAEKFIRATYDGQTELGLAVFEIGENPRTGRSRPSEVVFGPDGTARVRPIDPSVEEGRHRHWLNEKSPTFLVAEPPAREGEDRFVVSFTVDGNKHLLLTARDLLSDKLVMKDYPVVKLK